MQRVDGLLLAGAGVLLVHQGAYTASALVGFESTVGHGHLATAWLLGSFAALAAVARAIIRSVKSRRLQIDVLKLAALLSLGYTAMEAVERIAGGINPVTLASEPVFWLGLALAPLVALVLHFSIATVERVVGLAMMPSPRRRTLQLRPSPPFFGQLIPAVVVDAHSATRRGPPSNRF